ncbi:chromate resistance protein ChrB domain-containing protein [Microbulbifer sp. SSSA007]|uniref:chromate resistance protein ChrB domain-containing protein n=1 Tax=Microbulbifer sp. SSSA007 TaxID=3243379 RepID=UPI00403980BA
MGSIFRVISVLLCLCLTACSRSEFETPQAFVSEYGLGPDKWATAWLLTRHVNPEASLLFVEQGESLPAGIEFDTPESDLRRIENQTAFEVTQVTYAVEDPVVLNLVHIIRDIEVNFWGADKTPEAQVIESAFRGLQESYGRDTVPADCYLKFFDRVYSALSQSTEEQKPLRQDSLAMTCDAEVHASEKSPVQEMAIADLLMQMQQGKRIVFVDVREEQEFAEAHIPDALNIPLRELDDQIVKQLDEADYVVSYCVKDFRGFEMAKALKMAGIENSVILKPYGIKGWVTQGLPTVGSKAMQSEEALRLLNSCVSTGRCPGFDS